MLKDLNIEHLGQLVDLSMKASHYGQAQIYLNEIQSRINTMTKSVTEPNELLAELPMVPATNDAIPAVTAAPEPVSTGPPRDENGHITRISVKLDDPGYDAEVHENTALKIYCDGIHFPTAHTADEIEGAVWFHRKNEAGRIKTIAVHGKVEIKGLDQ